MGRTRWRSLALWAGMGAITWTGPFTANVTAQETLVPVDLDAVRRIREEGLGHSHIEELARHLTEVLGPRLTGSEGLASAEAWAADRLRAWGLDDVAVEPWGVFGRGWEAEGLSASVVEPFFRPLHAQALAWTAGTGGALRVPAVIVPGGSADASGLVTPSEATLDSLGSALRGAAVLLGPATEVGVDSVAPEVRWPAQDILPSGPRSPTAAPRAGAAAEELALIDSIIADIRVRHARRDALLRERGVVAVLSPSQRANGVLEGLGNWAGIDPSSPEPLPELIVAREQYNEIYRNVRDGVPVSVRLSAENRFLPSRSEANVLADLRGSEHPDEYVVIGAHLDAWHLAGGATDNAAGAVVMMEAMRILRTLGLRPRRTIRMALWSGEEEGLLGSKGWLENHPELPERISYYLNLDNGTGRIRGIRDQGRPSLLPVFENIFWPLKDLGVVGAVDGSSGSSDHVVFEAAGVPGLTFVQDPIEYNRRTHHSELDGFDHLVIDDLKQAAVVVAVTAYHLAMEL